MNSTTIRKSIHRGLPRVILLASLTIFIPSWWGNSHCWGQAALHPPGEDSAQADTPANTADSNTNQLTADQLYPVAAQDQRQFRYWTTNWRFRNINIATLARRLARIGIRAPVELEGEVSVAFSVSIPINALRDATAYRILGSLESSRLRIESTQLSLNTGVNYVDGIASLTNLRGAFLGGATVGEPPELGQFQGGASLRLAGEGERLARVNLAVQQLRLAVLTGAFARDSDFRINARGTATGSLQWVAPVDTVTDATTWEAEGQLAIQDLSVDNRPPLDLDTGALEISQGKVSVPNMRINVVDVPAAGLTANLDADFRDTQRWSARVVSERLPIESVSAVLALGAVPATQGELTLDLEAQGALVPLDWQVEGRLQSPGLSIYGVSLGELDHALTTDAGRFELSPATDSPLQSNVGAVRADYAISPEAIELAQLHAELFGGQIEGDFRWARERDSEHRAHLDWSQLALRWDVGAVATGVPGEILLRTQGRLAWQAPADAIELPAEHTFRATLQIDELALAGQPIGSASLQVRAVEGELALRGDGALLGGTFEVDSATRIPEGIDWSAWLGGHRGPEWPQPFEAEPGEPLSEPSGGPPDEPLGAIEAVDNMDAMDAMDPPAPQFPVTGRLRFQGISLARVGGLLGRWIGNGATGRDWSGRGDGVVQFDFGSPAADGALMTQSRIGLFNFAIDRSLISRALTIDLRSRGSELVIDRVRGSYAGGVVEMGGQWSLAGGPRQLDVSFSRVDASRALLPLSTDASQWLRGEMSGRVRSSGGRVLRLTGSLEGRRAELFGFPLGTVRSGLTSVVRQGGWELRFPDVALTVARGRVTGNAILRSSHSGPSFDLNSNWSALNVNFEELTRGLGATRRVGRGNLSGSLSLDGRNIRGASDLAGRFEGTLGGTEAAALPGWNRIRTYLGPIGSSALTFTDGQVRGRILRGLALIDQLALRSSRLRVAASGSIRLDNSRMDMDAVAATGDFSAQDLVLRAAARRLALVAAPPVGMLLSLNQLLNDRIVFLQVTGTPGTPIVRVRPVETLGRNVLRYFLQEITLGGSTLAAQVMTD